MTDQPKSETPRTDHIAARRAYAIGRADLAVCWKEMFDISRQLERELNAARAEIEALRKLKNIYHGLAVQAVECEEHTDVIAPCCPICLMNERDEARELNNRWTRAYMSLPGTGDIFFDPTNPEGCVVSLKHKLEELIKGAV